MAATVADIPDFLELTLKNQAVIIDLQGRRSRAEGKDGAIILMKKAPAPLISCFFYMH